MSDHNARYIEAMTKLYGSDKPSTCQRPGCSTVTLAAYCEKHRQPSSDQINRSGEPMTKQSGNMIKSGVK